MPKKSAARKERIVVTGGAGFIGSHLALRLGQRYQVIALDRIDPVSAPETIGRRIRAMQKSGIQYIQGDLSEPSFLNSLSRTIAGAKAIVHTAAPVREKGPLEEFRAMNVRATLRLAQQSRLAGVQKWIQLSSVMVYGFHYRDNIDETGPLSGDGNPYCITKIESEHALLGLQGMGMDVTILRPGDVYGRGSEPWVVRPLRMMKARQFLVLDGGRYRINHVHVHNLVSAVELVVKKNVPGQIFNITDGQSSSCLEYFGALARMAGFPDPTSLPSAVAKVGAGLMEFGSALVGRQSQLNREALKFVMRPGTVSSKKAMEYLGYRPLVSLTDGLADLRHWLESDRPDLLA